MFFTGKDYLCNVQVIIINYDLLSRKQDELVEKKMQVIVFDECHFLKSSKSQRCKVFQDIKLDCTKLRYRLNPIHF